jgi:hypothetical protein
MLLDQQGHGSIHARAGFEVWIEWHVEVSRDVVEGSIDTRCL